MQGPCRTLAVRKRPRGGTTAETCFVRLHPSTARALWRDALPAGENPAECPSSCWSVTHERGTSAEITSGIEFMPLQIASEDGEAVMYASYNGGDIEEENTIELPDNIESDLTCQSQVCVRVVPFVLPSSEVLVEALSAEDWACFQRHSEWLEGGGFLGQVSLLYKGQAITIKLPDGTKAGLCVIRVEKEEDDSVWPTSDSTLENSFSNCRRLVADTEIVVLPGSWQSQDHLSTFNLQLALEDYSLSMQQVHSRLPKAPPLVPCPPGTAVLNPSDWPHTHPYARISAPDASFLVTVQVSENVKKGHIVLHPLSRISVGLPRYQGKVQVENLLPSDFDQATSNGVSALPDIVLTTVQFVWPPEDSIGRPAIVPVTTLPFSETIGNSIGFVPNNSLFAVTSQNGDQPAIFRAASKFPSEREIMLPVGELRKLIEPGIPSSIHRVERILVPDTDALPPALVFPEALLKLSWNIQKGGSFVLVGESGAGKTHSALVLAAMSHFLTGRRVIYLDCKSLKNVGRMVDILDRVKHCVLEALQGNAILVFDDIDHLVTRDTSESPNESGSQVQQPNLTELEQCKLLGDHFRLLLEEAKEDLTVIFTSFTPDVASAVLCTDARLSCVNLPLLTVNEKLEVLQGHFRCRSESAPDSATEQVQMALSAIDFDGIFRSFLPVDLYTFSLRLQKRRQQNEGELKLPNLLEDELNRFVPKNRDSSLAESTPSEALWEEIGGLLNAKEELLNTVFRPLVYRRIYEKSRVRLPRGILLFGPSGCGKSFIVPALAQLCRLPLIMCRGPELLDRYIGGSEAKVRELFSRAYRAAPCILLMDEFDALAPKRGSDSTGVTDRVVNQLLTFLDGVEDVSASSTVYIIATSCRPDKIDRALLRPGRLEKHIHIGLPENREEMIDVIRKIAKKYSLGPRVLDSYCSSIDWASRIMSPADVRAVFQSAHILALQHELSSNPKSAQDICIDKSQLQSAFSQVRNSLSKDDSVYYAKMQAHFGKNTARTDLAHLEEAHAVPLRTALK